MAKNLFDTSMEPMEVVSSREPLPVNQEPIDNASIPEPVVDEFKDWDKQKAIDAYRTKQSEADRFRIAYEKLNEEKIQAEARAKVYEEQLLNKTQAPVPEPQAPIRPVKPLKPAGYNKADAMSYPDSDSARYEAALEKYYDQKEIYDEWEKGELHKTISKVNKTLEEQKNADLQNQEFAQRKAAQIARIARSNGGDLIEAGKVFEFTQQAMQKDDPMWYINLYRQSQSQAQKTQQASTRATNQQSYVAPGVTLPNNDSNDVKFEKQFISDIGSRKSNLHGLFKTEKRT